MLPWDREGKFKNLANILASFLKLLEQLQFPENMII